MAGTGEGFAIVAECQALHRTRVARHRGEFLVAQHVPTDNGIRLADGGGGNRPEISRKAQGVGVLSISPHGADLLASRWIIPCQNLVAPTDTDQAVIVEVEPQRTVGSFHYGPFVELNLEF